MDPQENTGLREAQVAASHSIAAHFWSKNRPAIIVMPTGSGKTAVMMLASILLRPKRVLVVAPSRLLREQLAKKFRAMDPLVRLGALDDGVTGPGTYEVKKRITLAERWESLSEHDVVVTTPYAASPGIKGVPHPDRDLFDLVIFDEAHHTPAPIYRALRGSFPAAKILLFTATPFRRDEQEISGDLIFTYELGKAVSDGIFGRLQFIPVEDPGPGPDRDKAIARAAAEQFVTDKNNGFIHRVVVRASSRSRADALAGIYSDETSLRLRTLHSGLSAKHIQKAVEDLRSATLDGVIVVDMLGEGFDLPSLKIAALHSPHKSLAVTLQFIGRFARTASEESLGQATFFAIPAEIDGPAGKLYLPGAEWNELVGSLGEAQLAAETELRQFIGTFASNTSESGEDAPPTDSLDDDTAWRLLRSVRPYFHVKVYETAGPVALDAELAVPPGLDPVLVRRSAEHRAVIWVGKKISSVLWSRYQDWHNVSHELFIVIHEPTHGLLFICASRRENAVYDALVESVVAAPGTYRRLAPDAIHRVLRGVDGAEFFSVGMRNRAGLGGGGEESYRMLSGPSAGRAVRAQDAISYGQGHAFCRGLEAGQATTVGYSSGSKVWSNRRAGIFELFRWVKSIAVKLSDPTVVKTGSGLDHLKPGRRVDRIPCAVIAADLPPDAYRRENVVVRVGETEIGLVEVGLKPIDTGLSTVKFMAVVGSVACEMELDISLGRVEIRPLNEAAKVARVYSYSGHSDFLASYLQEDPPVFLLEDLSMLRGDELEEPADRDTLPPIDKQIKGVDWTGNCVDVFSEKATPHSDRISIFKYIEEDLLASNAAVVFTDDGANEIADYVAIENDGHQITVRLFHCKAARSNPKKRSKIPNNNIGELYEVIGQAVKGRRWLNPRRLLDQIKRRHSNATKSFHFCLGDIPTVEQLLANPARVLFRVTVVQPALSTTPKETIASLLSAADASMRGGHQTPLEFWGSAPGKAATKPAGKRKMTTHKSPAVDPVPSTAADQLPLFKPRGNS